MDGFLPYGAGAYAEGRMLAASEGPVGLIRINQPEKHNAMSVAMWQGLAEILDLFERDSAIRAVLLTGAGGRAFCSGADISQFEAERSDANAQQDYERRTRAGRLRLGGFQKPVIAAISGYCLGGGLALAMHADLRLADATATFGIPAARLGIAYAFPLVQKLVGLIGPGQARRLLYGGERFDAAEALRIGLIEQLVTDGALDAAARDLARRIGGNAPLSVRAAKLAVDAAELDSARRDEAAVERAIAACFDSDDYREGRAAFAAKRPPRFVGR